MKTENDRARSDNSKIEQLENTLTKFTEQPNQQLGIEAMSVASFGFAVAGLALTQNVLPDWTQSKKTDLARVLKGLSYPRRNMEF